MLPFAYGFALIVLYRLAPEITGEVSVPNNVRNFCTGSLAALAMYRISLSFIRNALARKNAFGSRRFNR